MKKIYLILILIIIQLLIFGNNKAYADAFRITVSPLSVNFYVEDIYGNVSGYYPPSGFVVGELPYLNNYIVNGESDVENPTPYQQWHELNPNGDKIIPSGKYKLVIFGNTITTETQTEITIYINKNGGNAGIMPVKYILPGFMYKYEFTIDNVPTKNSFNFTKFAAPNDLIADIHAAQKLGYFTTPGIYQSLLAKAQDAQTRLAAGQPIPAKNVLNALINDINAQKGKQINTIAADILIEDAQYIINHI